MHGLVQPPRESAQNHNCVLLKRDVHSEKPGRVRTEVGAHLDVPLGFLIVDEGSDALHEVRRVLVMVLDDAHAARGVVRADVVAEGVEVALDEIGGVSGSVRCEGDEGGSYVRGRAGLTSA